MADSASLLLVKRLIHDASGARDFLRRAMAAGFQPTGEDWLGVHMEGHGCEFIFSVLVSQSRKSFWSLFKRPDRISGLVFKEGDGPSQALISEGEPTFHLEKPGAVSPREAVSHEYCPIFERKDGALRSIGLWALDSDSLEKCIAVYKNSGQIDSILTRDLKDLAQPTLEFLLRAKTRRVPNTAVDLGHGVRFENGVFVMIDTFPAPNEENNPATRYVLQVQDGVAMLKRTA